METHTHTQQIRTFFLFLLFFFLRENAKQQQQREETLNKDIRSKWARIKEYDLISKNEVFLSSM